MIEINSKNPVDTVCDFDYLYRLMGGKKHLIKKIMDTFSVQIKEELKLMNDAIIKKDYTSTKKIAHTMKSTVSIMGISTVVPVLQEMENLVIDTSCSDSYRDEKLTALNLELNVICQKALVETENYNFPEK